MASITEDPNGFRIQFVGGDGKRRAIRMRSGSTRSQTEAVKVKVAALATAIVAGHPPEDEVTRWLNAKCEPELYGKLVKAGLAKARESAMLKGWLGKCIEGKRLELKPKSIKKLEQTQAKLLAHFASTIHLRKITSAQASEWREFLIRSGISIASVKIHVGNAKTMLAEAKTRGIIAENPFAHLTGGSTASTNQRYVTPDDWERVLAKLHGAQWRLLFGLARWGGVRIPSETYNLTVSHVDWDRGRLTVESPKTERHAGKEKRIVPISPKLMRLLKVRRDEMGENDVYLARRRGGQIYRTMTLAIKRSGVESWDDMYQTLRRSCEQEWALTFPQYVISNWAGHGILVSGKHYVNSVPDEHYDKAAHDPTVTTTQSDVTLEFTYTGDVDSAAHQTAQQTPKTAQNGSQAAAELKPENTETPVLAGVCVEIEKNLQRGRRDSNPQPPDRQSGTLTN
jgi:integrase